MSGAAPRDESGAAKGAIECSGSPDFSVCPLGHQYDCYVRRACPCLMLLGLMLLGWMMLGLLIPDPVRTENDHGPVPNKK